MNAVISALCVAALLPALPGPATATTAPAAADAASHQSVSPTRKDWTGRIVVPVMIDGKGPFRFLLDTGADGSMISSRLAQRLGLAPSRSGAEQVEGTTGSETMPWVTIARLRIGSIVRSDVRMPISQSTVLAGLDGILGMAGFGDVQVAVDFRHNQVKIAPPRGIMWGYLKIRASITRGGLLMIPARVGDVAVEAVIDTGAEVTLGNLALRSALLRSAAKQGSKAEIYGVTKQVSNGGAVLSPTIRLGPAAIRQLTIVYSDIPIFRVWHLESRPALIIGMNVLGSVAAVVLDYHRACVYMRPQHQPSVSISGKELYSPHLNGMN